MKLSFRNMFQTVFGKTETQANSDTAQYTNFKMLNGYDEMFAPIDLNYSQPLYDDSTVRSCIDTIAKHVAKLRPTHVRKVNGKVMNQDSSLDSLLAIRPNEFMSTYDFIYKIIAQLYTYNNALIYVKTDYKGNILGLYPLEYSAVQLKEANNQMFCKFYFMDGTITEPYTSIIHIRRHFNREEFFGESNIQPMNFLLNLLRTCLTGLKNAILNSNKLRGLLKFTTPLRPEDLAKQLENFQNAFLNVKTSSSSGVAAVDSKAEFQQLTSDIKTTNTGDLEFIRKDIYRYYGLNESIISGNYTEEQWDAFYESTIEPLAIQMSQEFTAKLFTEKQKGFGNEIIFTTNRLNYSSVENRVKLVQALLPQGILTVNEAREMFGFSPVDGGDARQISLNFVNADKQDKYQLGEDATNGNMDSSKDSSEVTKENAA